MELPTDMPAMPEERDWTCVGRRLTGKQGVRRQKWSGRMILRVQVEVTSRRSTGETRTDVYWRDAEMADLIGSLVPVLPPG